MKILKTKKCSGCGLKKDYNNFYKQSRSKDGLCNFCKSCALEYSQKWHKDNLEHDREYSRNYHKNNRDKDNDKRLKYRFGITLEDYNKMSLQQDGVCVICKKPETSIERKTGVIKNLCVDHDHKTNKVRALLCGKCNKALGLLNDDIFLLKNSILYLEKHA